MSAGDIVTRWLWTCLIISVVMHGDVEAGDWVVRVLEDSIQASPGSSVTLPCTYDFPEKSGSHRVLSEMWCLSQSRCITPTYIYHSAGIFPDPAYRGRVQYLGKLGSKNCTLRITNLQKTDSGVYVFRFITDHLDSKLPEQKGVTLQVTDSGNLLTIIITLLGIVILAVVAVICVYCKRRTTSHSLQRVQIDDSKL